MIFTRADLHGLARTKKLHLIEHYDIAAPKRVLYAAPSVIVRDDHKVKILKDSRGTYKNLPRDADGLVLASDLMSVEEGLTPEPLLPSSSETLMLRIGNSEKSMEVPRGFWQMERTGLKRFIAEMWPGVTWASNGAVGIYAINIRYAEAGFEP